ncbi:MAG: DEAD/DEAH box helicase family protein [Henriciella sp.]
MTITTWALAPIGESENAKRLKEVLLRSEPDLDHPEIDLEIFSDIYLPERQIDLVLLYRDNRRKDQQLQTHDGKPIHSFVLIVEVKNHSPDNIRFRGTNLAVRYNGKWSDATHQCDQQTFAFKRFQQSSITGDEKRYPVFVQRAIWLARTPEKAVPQAIEKSSVPVVFQDVTWSKLIRYLSVPNNQTNKVVQAFFPDPQYHSFETLYSKLTREVVPTNLDLERVNILSQKKRFKNQKYVQNLGDQLLVFKGRGGTGKTVTLIQMAMFLARQGYRCVLVTYNHGLISDISRLLYFAAQRDPALEKVPQVQTRYSFIQDQYIRIFGEESDRGLVRHVMTTTQDLDDLEAARLARLLNVKDLQADFDFALIDEGQDWNPEQRDLIYKMFGAEHVVVADGVDQFVGRNRCRWDTTNVSQKQTVSLKSSLRTKGATCRIVGEIARELKIDAWDLEPDPEVFGGRLSILVDPIARSAMKNALALIDRDMERSGRVQFSDNLICMPSSKMSGGYNFEWLFDQAVKQQGRNSWRGFDEIDRRQYVYDPSQIKAVLYNSCRGMEGWTTVCLGLDAFFDFQIRHPRIDKEQLKLELQNREGMFADTHFEEEYATRAMAFAVNWLMIPLTRSIDHLVIHIADEQSRLGRILHSVSDKNRDAIEWLYPDDINQT